jgi:hypothetical protein
LPNQSDLVVITTSERSAFRRCPQKWYWRYRMGFVPRGESPDALWFGIGVHIGLAEWYQQGRKRGPHPAKTFREWVGEEEREIRAAYSDHERDWEDWEDKPKFEDARELGIAMLEGYVDKYGKDDSWDVIAIEQQFRIKIMRGGVPIAEFWSTWDGVYRDLADRGKIKLMEHKTATAIQTAYLELDDQGGSYWAVAGALLRKNGLLKPEENIEEITYNFLRKAFPDERPRNETGAYLNKDGTVSKRQPPPLFVREPVHRLPSEQRAQLERLSDEVAVMQAIRDGVIPITKSTTKDCTFCEFFLMCKLHEQGGDKWLALARADFFQQNPYERYQKSA